LAFFHQLMSRQRLICSLFSMDDVVEVAVLVAAKSSR
jgi:hypothetical protein